MKRRLFLSGPIGCGKSTLIRSALGGLAKSAGGFVTERAFDKNGLLIGFNLLPACSIACLNRQCTALSFLNFSGGKAQRNNDVFRLDAVRLLTEAMTKPFAIIDEFGGYELLVPEFSQALMAFLESNIPCVGVLKAPAASEALRTSVSLPSEYLDIAAKLRAALKSDPDAEILETSGRGDRNAQATLRAWMEEYANVE
ncbi:nucleoside-triphosphatase [Oscillospiraceae bacterium LTW-04]|nr:nucleoside-triphosphatase [Oscillospiraceae bacterium MB24-C1]